MNTLGIYLEWYLHHSDDNKEMVVNERTHKCVERVNDSLLTPSDPMNDGKIGKITE